MPHIPVLTDEVLKFLNPQAGQNFIDCTLGDGGHAAKILAATTPDGKVLGFDLDGDAVKVARENLGSYGSRLLFKHASYTQLSAAVTEEKFGPIAGVLLDLGFSSPQIEERGRGLSFQRDEPLDMRYDQANNPTTAALVVNTWTKDELAKIIGDYGEERFAQRIAGAIITSRREKRIMTTAALALVVMNAVPKNYEHGRIHPATRTFQALRIAVNDELNSVAAVLPQAREALAAGGRLAVIAFHSLEDRIVKNFFRDEERAGRLKILTPKPITALETELKNNPRSRSAKLRVAEKI
jgi:16S rRNA (cytosine1402-N4)-methyltransferase